MNSKRIYLDNAATTRVDPRVLEAMLPYFSEKFGNASSVHSFGRETKVALETARESVATLFCAQPSEITFTSGGTEADNFAIKGIMLRQITRGKNHIITSKAEHQAVLKTCEYLEENGLHVTYLNVDQNGIVDPDELRREITPRTGLITLMHANNEIGSLNPVYEIASIAHEHEIFFHSDTTQSAGKVLLDSQMHPFDLAVSSAHKINGPKGIGALFIRRGIELEQWCHGGPQERGKRGGTENVALAVGYGVAAWISIREMEERLSRWRVLRETLSKKINEISPHIRLNGDAENCLPNILNISFDSNYFDLEGETLLMNLDLNGVAVSSGSACTSGSIEPSHVLRAMGYDEKTADASLRFSFGSDTTVEEVVHAVSVLKQIVTTHAKH